MEEGKVPGIISASAATKESSLMAGTKGGHVLKTINIKKLVILSLLIAIEIILSRFFSISTPIVKISFAFLPVSLVAMLYGPLYSGIVAAIADILGVLLFPAGPFFPGFTLTAFLTGCVYGVFLYKREKNLVQICAAVLIIVLFLNLGLDTLWLQIITGKAYVALLPLRILKSLLMAPVQVVLIHIVSSRKVLMPISKISGLQS